MPATSLVSRTLGRIGRPDTLVAAGLVILLLAALAALRPAEAVVGQARVVDGDTLVIGRRRIRIAGIDAPELGQLCGREPASERCGQRAREALRALLADRTVTCRVTGRDRWGRGLAACEVGGLDIGAALVRAGWAVGYRDYATEERLARAESTGLWASPFERPADWRRRRERAPAHIGRS